MATATDIPQVQETRTGRRLAWPVFLALAAALPTLVWAFWGGDLIVDDWYFAAVARFEGITDFPFRWRPVASSYHALTFSLLGAHSLPHLLLLAGLNGLAAVLVWQVARRLLPTRLAVLTSLAWVSLPNRGSMRLWITNAPNMLSLCLLLWAALLVCRQYREEKRAGSVPAVVGLVVLSALAYEGSIALGLLVVAAAAWRGGATRRARLARVAA
ncbi:MAG: glycosyltransferase family 39 protein, partial [Acidimicrobiales bacterium]